MATVDALRERAQRYRQLVNGMIQESKRARGGALGLTRQEVLEYSLPLVKAVETLGDAGSLMERAALRAEAMATAVAKPREGR